MTVNGKYKESDANYVGFAIEAADELRSMMNVKKQLDDVIRRLNWKYSRFVTLAIDCETEDHAEKSETKTKKDCFLYYLFCEETGFVKIGITSDLDRRLRQLISASGLTIKLLDKIRFPSREIAEIAERFLHQYFGDRRRITNNVQQRSTEWFSSTIIKDLPDKDTLFRMMEKAKDNDRMASDIIGSLIHIKA